MSATFESEGYDAAMDSWVGRYVRAVSLDALMRRSDVGSRVLDIGCGTGAEAAVLSKARRIVYGFDPSPSMVRAARAAAPGATIIEGSVEDLGALADEQGWSDLDLVYSSLGPLNCVDDLRIVLKDAARLLHSGGYIVFSTMNRFPALEVAALAATSRLKKAYGRTRSVQDVPVGDGVIRACYHTMSDIRSALPDTARIVSSRALPLLLPPLRTARRSDPPFAPIVRSVDRALSPLWPFNRFGDHILVEMIIDGQTI